MVYLWPFGLFYGHFAYFVDIWYILWLIAVLLPVLVRCTKENLATLLLLAFKYIVPTDPGSSNLIIITNIRIP
jgi:hypothetical protein